MLFYFKKRQIAQFISKQEPWESLVYNQVFTFSLFINSYFSLIKLYCLTFQFTANFSNEEKKNFFSLKRKQSPWRDFSVLQPLCVWTIFPAPGCLQCLIYILQMLHPWPQHCSRCYQEVILWVCSSAQWRGPLGACKTRTASQNSAHIGTARVSCACADSDLQVWEGSRDAAFLKSCQKVKRWCWCSLSIQVFLQCAWSVPPYPFQQSHSACPYPHQVELCYGTAPFSRTRTSGGSKTL